MIRTAEWVRGYFDGEGCVHISTHPTPYGRNAQLVVETTDFDLMRDLRETLESWGINSDIKTRPPGPRANLPKARLTIKRREAMEVFFSKVRPLSEKHERRLALLLLHWENRDRFRAALAAAVAYKDAGMTRRAAAATAGVTLKQLDNHRAYRSLVMRIDPRNPPWWAKAVDSPAALNVHAPRRRAS